MEYLLELLEHRILIYGESRVVTLEMLRDLTLELIEKRDRDEQEKQEHRDDWANGLGDL